MIRKIIVIGTLLFLFVGLYFLGWSMTGVSLVQWLEHKSLDWCFAWRGPIPTTGDVVVIAIDDKSLSHEGRWPWPRATMAQLVRQIQSANPKIIALDIIFSEPAAGDDELAHALHDSKSTLLGYYFYQSARELEDADVSDEVLQQSFDSILPAAFPEMSGRSGQFPEMEGVVANIPPLARAAAAQGYFNVMPDRDGSVRRFYLMANYRGKVFPFMGLMALSRHEGGFAPVLVANAEGILEGIAVGKRMIPTSAQGSVLVNYRGGPESFHIISAADVLSGKFSKETLVGKTILVGATAVGIYDLRVTPISPNMPGVVAEANLIDMLYRGDFLQHNTWTVLWNVFALTMIPFLLGLILFRLRLLSGVGVALLVIIVYIFSGYRLFVNGYVVALAAPSLEWLFLMVGITTYRGWTEERQKRQIRQAFRAYLHPKLVEELTEHPEGLALGGKRANCTMLFCDVKSFSTISEKMDPESLTRMMNAFFDPICQVIMAEGGYVDKLIGDAVMAVFGAPVPTPNHAAEACRAALAMQKVVHTLEPKFQKEFGIKEFKLRIGIHTGPVVVGNMGTSQRLNYTVMGDAVNLASRLEGANKELGTEILISQATVDVAGSAVAVRYVNEITVKGKEERIKVYTPN